MLYSGSIYKLPLPHFYTSNPSAATISVYYPWAMSLLLVDVHLSELVSQRHYI